MKRLFWMGIGLAGCTVYATEPAEPVGVGADTARICVVRAGNLAFGAPITVHDNGRLVGATEPETYFCYRVEPGAHVIKSTLGDDIDRKLGTSDIARATIAAEAGRSYYLAQQVGLMGIHGLAWVEETAAQKLLEECQPVRVVQVPGDETLPRPEVAVPALSLHDPAKP
jgi:hypothetical protein